MKKVKICGITRIEDALHAGKSGAWAVGFILFEKSPRYISPPKIAEITENLPVNLEKIGVFVNSTIENILNCVNTAKLTMIQLHGEETPEFCEELAEKTNLPIIKAFRIRNQDDLSQISNYKNKVFAVLLDSYNEAEHGGTGEVFNWDLAVKAKTFGVPIILAGGLNSENILEAEKIVAPFAFDVSSGVEKSKGVKDSEKMTALFKVPEQL